MLNQISIVISGVVALKGSFWEIKAESVKFFFVVVVMFCFVTMTNT